MGGPCPQCGDDLAPDQRYCISCGQRVESALAPSYMPGTLDGLSERGQAGRAFPIPPAIATTFLAAALGFGVIMGTAISPNLSGLVAGDRGDPVIVQVPPEEPDQGKGAKGGEGGSGSGSGGSGSTGAGSFGGYDSGSGFYGSSGSYGGYPGTSGAGTGSNGPGGVGPPSDDKKKPKYTFLSGTVIHRNPVARSYTLASGGKLNAIHTESLPSIGAKLKVPIRKLANGTFAEAAGRQNEGSATQAKFSGVVTYSKDGAVPNPDVYTVSARGASVVVFASDPAGSIDAPTVGATTTTDVEIRTSAATVFPPGNPVGPCGAPATPLPSPKIFPGKQLWQTAEVPGVDPGGPVPAIIETVVQQTCPSPAPRAVLSSDDIRYTNSDWDVLAAAGVDVTKLVPGQALMAAVTIDGGVVTDVTGTASDNGIKGADDPSTSQGNLAKAAQASDRRIKKAAAKRARR